MRSRRAIIRMASGYGTELGISQGALIGSVLAVQFVGIPFSFLFGMMAGKIGAMPAGGSATMPFPLFHPRAGVCQSVGGSPQARPSVSPVPAQTPRPR